MQKNTVYPYRIKEGAYREMCRILRYPANCIAPEMDSRICRVTVTDYSLELTLLREFVKPYEQDVVMAVRLLENDERDFIVMASLLESLAEPVIVRSD